MNAICAVELREEATVPCPKQAALPNRIVSAHQAVLEELVLVEAHFALGVHIAQTVLKTED